MILSQVIDWRPKIRVVAQSSFRSHTEDRDVSYGKFRFISKIDMKLLVI